MLTTSDSSSSVVIDADRMESPPVSFTPSSPSEDSNSTVRSVGRGSFAPIPMDHSLLIEDIQTEETDGCNHSCCEPCSTTASQPLQLLEAEREVLSKAIHTIAPTSQTSLRLSPAYPTRDGKSRAPLDTNYSNSVGDSDRMETFTPPLCEEPNNAIRTVGLAVDTPIPVDDSLLIEDIQTEESDGCNHSCCEPCSTTVSQPLQLLQTEREVLSKAIHTIAPTTSQSCFLSPAYPSRDGKIRVSLNANGVLDAMRVGAVSVVGNGSQSSYWDSSSSSEDDNDSEYDTSHGLNTADVESPAATELSNSMLPTAELVCDDETSSDSGDEEAVRQSYMSAARAALVAEAPRAEPVCPKAQKEQLHFVLVLGVFLPLLLLVIGAIMLTRQGPTQHTNRPTPQLNVASSPTSPSSIPSMVPSLVPTSQPSLCHGSMDPHETNDAPTASPTVVLSDGRRAFTSTQELYLAVDEYQAILAQNTKPPENSDIAQKYGHPIGTWDVSRLTDFSRVFDPQRSQRLEVDRAPDLISGFDEDLGGWDVSNATTLSGMFAAASNFTGRGLEHWNVGKVADFSFLFAQAYVFNGNISRWNMSNAITVDAILYDAQAFNGSLSHWNTSKIQSMSYMFFGAQEFQGGDLTKWDVGNVLNMEHMFDSSSFSGKVSTWDTSRVLNMNDMFRRTFVNDDLSSWSVGSVQSMRGMFAETQRFVGGNLSAWNTSSVTDMTMLFYRAAAFLGHVSLWDVSNVKCFVKTFERATIFDGDLSRWQTDSASTMDHMFYFATSFSGGNLSMWDTGKVTNMNSMFAYSYAFNSDLSGWNVSSLQDASAMFLLAKSFNHSLCSWGTRLSGRHVKMVEMFSSTSCTNKGNPSTTNYTAGPLCSSCGME